MIDNWRKSTYSADNATCVETGWTGDWRKSTYSADNASCVETGWTGDWRKSTYSADNASCVETGRAGPTVGYRDTKQAALPDDERPTLLFGKDAAGAFLNMIKSTH